MFIQPSQMIRKLYDPQVAEVATGEVEIETKSIAELMAKQGVMNSTENEVATPININKETNPVKEVEPVETTTTTPNAESVTTKETPLPTEEPKAAEPQKDVPQPKVQTWQEVLRQQQPDTILKELGFDDKAIRLAKELNGFEKVDFFANLVNAWKTEGDLKGYLKELSTDYKTMSAEDVMRHQLRAEYPKASDKALDVLYKKEIIEKYHLDSEDEAEVEEGRLLLEAKADRYRDEHIKNQEAKLFPKPPEAKPQEPDTREQEARQAFEAYKSQVNESSYTKDIVANNKITLGEGDEKFQYPVNAGEITEILFNEEKWQETQFDIVKNPDGSVKSYSPKVEHQLLTAAVALYGKDFLNEYAKHFKSIGGKSAIESIDNAKPPDTNTTAAAEAAPKTAAEAMAKQGAYNSGGYNR